ncbi:MAG: FAD/NAD(P)-binding oxidoreductase [Armatimonadota bacterium]|nr:FAD/NAD(P)-binding oxidoreductase [Armatimonadota bacterium]
MARPEVVVLGGGFGGIAAAHRLRERLGDGVGVTLLDRRSTFMMGLRILWTITGRADRAAGTRSLEALGRHGIRFVNAEVTAIDPVRKRVETAVGTFSGDALVVALGAELRPDVIPGYAPEGSSLYDPEQAERIAARLAAFDGGRLGIGILGAPYKCPPAPFEAALLIDESLRRRGVRGRVELEVFTPLPSSLPVAGPEMCALVEGLLAAQDIRFLAGARAVAVEGREVVFERERRAYDLLLGVAPHRAPRAVKESGLTTGEWIRADRRTCEVPEFFNVFAVGDITEMPLANGMMLPKAGIFAQAHAVAAADVIAERFQAPRASDGFDGRGYCFMEVSAGRAAAVRGEFFAAPAPVVEVVAPSEATAAEKQAFETTRLSAWF